MIKYNLLERTDLAILNISSKMLYLENRIKGRIAKYVKPGYIQYCIDNWTTEEPKFRFFFRQKRLDSHYRDLNIWLAYKYSYDQLQTIIEPLKNSP